MIFKWLFYPVYHSVKLSWPILLTRIMHIYEHLGSFTQSLTNSGHNSIMTQSKIWRDFLLINTSATSNLLRKEDVRGALGEHMESSWEPIGAMVRWASLCTTTTNRRKRNNKRKWTQFQPHLNIHCNSLVSSQQRRIQKAAHAAICRQPPPGSHGR